MSLELARFHSQKEAQLVMRRFAAELGAEYLALGDMYQYQRGDGTRRLRVEKAENAGYWALVVDVLSGPVGTFVLEEVR